MRTIILLLLLSLLCGCSTSHERRVKELQKKKMMHEQGQSSDSEDISLAPGVFIPNVRSSEILIQHKAYILSFSPYYCTPIWVMYTLTPEHTTGPVPRDPNFYEDRELDSLYRVDPNEFKGTEWSRGHMAPAGDFKWDETAMSESCFMSNVCPQNPSLNQGSWEKLERRCRKWAQKNGPIVIITGPLYFTDNPVRIGNHKVAVPDAFFKCVVSLVKGNEKGCAFKYNNDNTTQKVEECVCTIDDIEEYSKIDFFAELPDDIEQAIESSSDLSIW